MRSIFSLACIALIACSSSSKPASPSTTSNATKTATNSQSHAPTPREHFQELVNGYLTAHENYKDVFWLTGQVDYQHPQPFVAQMDAWTQRIQEQLERFAGVSELSTRIASTYLSFRPTMMVQTPQGLISMDLHLGTVTQEQIEKKLGLLEICLVPKGIWTKDQFPSLLYYDRDWRAVKVTGISMPPVFEVALLYHEMGHALRDLVDHAPSATAPNTSDSWIGEEVEMHDLESQILNTGTNGKLFALYEKIRARTPNNDINDLIKAVSLNDLHAYDQIVETTQAGPLMSSVYFSQFFLGLGFYTIDSSSPNLTPEQRLMVKVAYYRFLSGR